jgi:hypothetical protein
LAIVRYAQTTVTGVMVVALLWVGIFLYENFYQPLTRAVVVAELKARVALATVNRQALEQTITAANERRRGLDFAWAELSDPFAPNRWLTPATDQPPATLTPPR